MSSELSSRPAEVDQTLPESPRFRSGCWTLNGTPFCYRSVLKFDLPPTPEGKVLVEARLTLTAFLDMIPGGWGGWGHDDSKGSNASTLTPISDAWSTDDVTWNSQPNVLESQTIELETSNSPDQTYTLDISDWARATLDKEQANHGFLLKMNEEVPYGGLLFHSPHSTLGPTPLLELDYNCSEP